MTYVGKIRADELEKWLDETSAPLSDDEMQAMSAYFDSEISSVNKILSV